MSVGQGLVREEMDSRTDPGQGRKGSVGQGLVTIGRTSRQGLVRKRKTSRQGLVREGRVGRKGPGKSREDW